MKTKRKTKTLLRVSNSEIFMKNLLIVSGIFVFLATFLFVIAANANYDAVPRGAILTGLDDKTEVLDRLYFVDSEDLIKEVGSFYAKRNTNNKTMTTYLEYEYPLVINRWNSLSDSIDSSSNNESDLTSLILGGIRNTVSGNNIIIFAGSDNVVNNGNDNATVRGGVGNRLLEGNSNGTPTVMVGGKKNQIYDGDGAIILGGENNEGSSDSIILGGENNKGGKGSIIAGYWVNGESNIFAFSNSKTEFKPLTSNTFYLNVNGGVGLNGDAFENGLHSHGAVSIGEIDISQPCTDANYGVEGFYNGCLVGCTSRSANNGQHWDLLNLTESCMDLCDIGNLDCVGEVDDEPAELGHCLYPDGKTIETVREELCSGLNPNNYNNAAFQYELVDQENCPSTDNANQCVYHCKSGYHLVNGKCYQDCTLPAGWSKKTIKHGESVIGYEGGSYTCYDDCGKHQKVMQCNDGTLQGKNIYKYESCTTNPQTQCYDKAAELIYVQPSKIANADCNQSCKNYSVSDNKCVLEFEGYYCKCNEGFEWNEGKSACIEIGETDEPELEDPDSPKCSGIVFECTVGNAEDKYWDGENHYSWNCITEPYGPTGPRNIAPCSLADWLHECIGDYDETTSVLNNYAEPPYGIIYHHSDNRGDYCSFSCRSGYNRNAISEKCEPDSDDPDNECPCEAGKYCNERVCLDCPNGTWSNAGSSTCTNICNTNYLGSCNFSATRTWSTDYDWKHRYGWTCKIGANTTSCVGDCSSDMVWDPSKQECVPFFNSCENDNHYVCNQGISKNNNPFDGGWTWDCYDGDNNKLNSSSCHECKDGYSWNGSDCVRPDTSLDPICNPDAPLSCSDGSEPTIITTNSNSVTWVCVSSNSDTESVEGNCTCTDTTIDANGRIVNYHYETESACLDHQRDHGCSWHPGDMIAFKFSEESDECTYTCPSGQSYNSDLNKCEEDSQIKPTPTGAKCGNTAFLCTNGNPDPDSKKGSVDGKHSAGDTVERDCNGIDYNGEECSVHCTKKYYKTEETLGSPYCSNGTELVYVGGVAMCAPNTKYCAVAEGVCEAGKACRTINKAEFGSSGCFGDSTKAQDGYLSTWPDRIDESNWYDGSLSANRIGYSFFSLNLYDNGEESIGTVGKSCGATTKAYIGSDSIYNIRDALEVGCYFQHTINHQDNGYTLICPTSEYASACRDTIPASEGRRETTEQGDKCDAIETGDGCNIACEAGYLLDVRRCKCMPIENLVIL